MLLIITSIALFVGNIISKKEGLLSGYAEVCMKGYNLPES